MRLSLSLTPSLLWISDTSFTLSSHSCLCLIGNSWISCYLISKQSTLSTSTGIPAWLTLNRWGWPDTDHQFSEERAVVRESCIASTRDPCGTGLPSPTTAPLSALEKLKTRNMDLHHIRKTSSCKNPASDAGRRTKICYLFTRILEWEKRRGIKCLSSPCRDLANPQAQLLLQSSACQCFLQVLLQCWQQDVLSSRVTAAQYKQQLNGWTALYTGMVW